MRSPVVSSLLAWPGPRKPGEEGQVRTIGLLVIGACSIGRRRGTPPDDQSLHLLRRPRSTSA